MQGIANNMKYLRPFTFNKMTIDWPQMWGDNLREINYQLIIRFIDYFPPCTNFEAGNHFFW